MADMKGRPSKYDYNAICQKLMDACTPQATMFDFVDACTGVPAHVVREAVRRLRNDAKLERRGSPKESVYVKL